MVACYSLKFEVELKLDNSKNSHPPPQYKEEVSPSPSSSSSSTGSFSSGTAAVEGSWSRRAWKDEELFAKLSVQPHPPPNTSSDFINRHKMVVFALFS